MFSENETYKNSSILRRCITCSQVFGYRVKIRIAAAVGVKEGYLERADMLVQAGANIINVDVAHGHMKQTIEVTRALKQKFGDNILLISGIVATKDSAIDLYEAGADCLLVGIGA